MTRTDGGSSKRRGGCYSIVAKTDSLPALTSACLKYDRLIDFLAKR
jgi:hypothetical protein